MGSAVSTAEEGAVSQFSTYLKLLLDECGEPIARVARGAGAERTSIHKALKDERTLPYAAVRSLARYLQLDLVQTRELNRCYEMLLYGDDAYGEQRVILDLLLNLSRLESMAGRGATPGAAARAAGSAATASGVAGPGARPQEPAPLPASGVVSGAPAVHEALRAMLRAETAQPGTVLYLYAPLDDTLVDEVMALWGDERRDFTLHQLVAFAPDRQGSEARRRNLGLLKWLLPLSLASRGRYFAHGFFEGEPGSVGVDPLPFFLATPRAVLRLNQRGTLAHVVADEALARVYRDRVEATVALCPPLNSYTSEPTAVLDSYMDGTGTDGYFTIMSQPCPGRYYTRELVERYLVPDAPHRAELVELCDRRFGRLRELSGPYCTIFTEEGLRALAQTGVLADLPADMVPPIDVDTRLAFLSALRADIAADVVTGCMADPGELSIPPYLTFTADAAYGLHVYATQGFEGGAYVCNVHIAEPGIGRAFRDFIQLLPMSRCVYAKGRTLAMFDELIAELTAGGAASQ